MIEWFYFKVYVMLWQCYKIEATYQLHISLTWGCVGLCWGISVMAAPRSLPVRQAEGL